MIDIEIIGLEQFGARMKLRAADMERRLLATMRSIGFDLAGQVKANKLSGQVLNVRTGRLRRSITSKVTQSGSTITLDVGTNVFYGLIHEFGPAATMRSAKANFRASIMPKRAFLRPTLVENESKVKRALAFAIAESVSA